MARMMGRFAQPWCPFHHAPAGLDCPDKGMDTRYVKRREDREWRREAQEAIVIRLVVAGVEYVADVHRGEDRWLWCEVEALPGCFASGRTIAELTEAATEAVRLVLAPTASPA